MQGNSAYHNDPTVSISSDTFTGTNWLGIHESSHDPAILTYFIFLSKVSKVNNIPHVLT